MALLHQIDHVEPPDMEFRYQGCLALLDGEEVVFIRHIMIGNDDAIYALVSSNPPDSDEMEDPTSRVDPSRLDPTFKFGWFNYNQRYAVYVNRNMYRSYKYGVTPDLVEIATANMMFYGRNINRQLRQPRVDAAKAFRLMHLSTYTPPGEAASMIRQGRSMNQALSDQVALTAGPDGLPILIYGRWMVGYLNPRNQVILYEGSEHLSEEIEEILPIESVVKGQSPLNDSPFNEWEEGSEQLRPGVHPDVQWNADDQRIEEELRRGPDPEEFRRRPNPPEEEYARVNPGEEFARVRDDDAAFIAERLRGYINNNIHGGGQ